MDLSIIIPATRPSTLAHVLRYLDHQSANGVDYEIIIVQESHDFSSFNNLTYNIRTKIIRQQPNHDCGAAARDRGLLEATGKYVTFWDDDNIYYQHAVATIYATAYGHDIGISRVVHQDMVIPIGNEIKAGYIDSMCLCVKKGLAIKTKWNDNGGRYNDYRWISKITEDDKLSINYTKIIIGEHL